MKLPNIWIAFDKDGDAVYLVAAYDPSSMLYGVKPDDNRVIKMIWGAYDEFNAFDDIRSARRVALREYGYQKRQYAAHGLGRGGKYRSVWEL